MNIYIPTGHRVEADLATIVDAVLNGAYRVVCESREEAGDLIHGVQADEHLASKIATHLLNFASIRSVEIHGFGKHEAKDGDLTVLVDPLDPSFYYLRRSGSRGLPYASCVTVFHAASRKRRFCDILAAGVIDLRSGDCWTAVRGEGAFLGTKQVRVGEVHDLDPRRNIYFADIYHTDSRWRIARVFEDLDGHVRSGGSAAYEMALVASGTAAAYISGRQGHRQLGVGYLLVTEAGGTAHTLDGHHLSSVDYDFNGSSPAVLSASEKLSLTIIGRWRGQETT